MRRKAAFFFGLALAAVFLLAASAGAEWKKSSKSLYNYVAAAWEDVPTWEYYENGKKVESFKGRKSVEIPEEVDALIPGVLKDLGRDFVLVVEPGSYAETFAKQYGYQYVTSDGSKEVVGYGIQDLQEKARWIIDNYITDNYLGRELTDEEKARVLHDWLITNTTYDTYDLQMDDEIRQRKLNGESTEDLEALREDPFYTDAVLIRGKGVCNSYSQAYSLLLYLVGVENRYLIGDTAGNLVPAYAGGTSLNHAWNLVLIDGQWYHVDVTWDNGDSVTLDDGPEDMVVASGNDNLVHFKTTDEGIKAWSARRTWDCDVSADDNTAGFVFTAEGTYYYGTPAETAVRTTGWVDYAYSTEGQDIGATILYNPAAEEQGTDPRFYMPDGRYYFDEADGKMATGWKKIGENTYFFREKGDMAVGWVDDGDSRYHMKDDGAMDTGWQTLVSPDFLVWSSEADDYVEAWVKYYFGTDGKMATGWKKIGTNTYYFGDKGNMSTGWVDVDGSRYHLQEDSGAMDTGWKTLVSPDFLIWSTEAEAYVDAMVKYYFGKDGKMATGLKELEGSTYYFYRDGHMAQDTTEEVTRNGKERECYFDGQGRMEAPGDLDGNRQIDGADAVRMMKYLAGGNEDVHECTADVDGNGTAGREDLQRMMDYFAGKAGSLE